MAQSTAFDRNVRSSENKSSGNISINESKPIHEGELTKRIEQQTARVPSVGYLGLAVGSMILSASIAMISRRKEFANFVGLWAPSFLLMGIYNKLVKLEGSDRWSTLH